jgi:hypothetical protein
MIKRKTTPADCIEKSEISLGHFPFESKGKWKIDGEMR